MEAGEFWTSSPVPQIKLTVMAATKGLISNKTTLSKVREVVTTRYVSMCNQGYIVLYLYIDPVGEGGSFSPENTSVSLQTV